MIVPTQYMFSYEWWTYVHYYLHTEQTKTAKLV